jgi:hypothetical protein
MLSLRPYAILIPSDGDRDYNPRPAKEFDDLIIVLGINEIEIFNGEIFQ